MAAKKKTLLIRRALDRATGALHTSVGKVTHDEPCEVPKDEAQRLVDSGLAELVGGAVPDETAGPDVQATANE